MVNRDLLRAQLIKHEGFRLFPYLDSVDKVTIGVGRNITDRGITSVTANQMLNEDIDRCLEELSKYAWFSCLNDIRQRALIDMVFNLGLTKFFTFTRMIMALEVGHFEEAADQMLESKWATQVGLRAQTLANMVRTGNDNRT